MIIKTKKAQGLPFNVIIIAAIAVVVLIIVIAIFRGKTTDISQDMSSCYAKGGVCVSLDDYAEKCQQEIPNAECPEGQVCCISLVS